MYLHAFMHQYIHSYIYESIHKWIYAYICMSNMCIYGHTYTHVCPCMSAYMHVPIYIHTYAYMHTCI